MTVVVNESRIDQLLRSPAGPTGRYVRGLGDNVVTVARRLCPVDTGELQSSIHATDVTRRHDGLAVRVGASADHARFVELGTRRMRPRPYLTPALEAITR